MDLHGALRSGIGENQNLVSVRVFKRNVSKFQCLALCFNPTSASSNGPREMSQRPVLPASDNLLSPWINNQNSAARVGANIRLPALISGDVPRTGGPAPVAENCGVGGPPLCPVILIVRIVVVSAAFRE